VSRYWKTCLYCGKQFKGGFGSLVCRKCEKTASMVHVAPGLFTKGPAAIEAARASAASAASSPDTRPPGLDRDPADEDNP